MDTNDPPGAPRRASKLGPVKESDEDDAGNVIWLHVSDKEMVELYGPDTIKETLNNEQEEKMAGRCNFKKPPGNKKEIDDYTA